MKAIEIVKFKLVFLQANIVQMFTDANSSKYSSIDIYIFKFKSF